MKKKTEETKIEPYFQSTYVPDIVQKWIAEMILDPNISMTRSGDDFVYNDYDKESDWQVIYVARIYAQVRARKAATK